MTIDGYCHCGISKYQPVDVVLGVMNKYAVDRVLCDSLAAHEIVPQGAEIIKGNLRRPTHIVRTTRNWASPLIIRA
jgi:hypothetical protein